MLIILLLFSGGACDWVEISQNHYRKEPIRKLVNFDHTTKSNRIYRNNSVTEKQWHRGAVDKVTNVANIRRVQYPSVKTNSFKTKHEDNRFGNNFNDHADTTEAEFNFISVKPNIQKFSMYDEDDEEFENQSKVTNRWTTTANIDHVKRPNPPRTVGNYFERRKIFTEKESVGENKVQNNIKQPEFSTPHLKERNKDIDEVNFNENNKFHTLEKPNFHRTPHGDDEIKLVSSVDSENRHSNYTFAKQFPKIKLIQTGDNENLKENDGYKKQPTSNVEYSDIEKFKPHDVSSHPFGEYFNTRNQFETPSDHNTDRSDYNVKNIEETVAVDAKPDVPVNKVEIAQIRDVKETAFPEPEDSGLNVAEGNSVKGMWKLMKIVADTIYKNTHRSFKSKITYLENLKSSVLTSIKDQIDSAWPDDARRPSASRAARDAQSRGHVDFPSSESTLMTISFLTFAVFLIKLVLQIIHTYKNKAMMVTPAVVAAVGRAAAAFKSPK